MKIYRCLFLVACCLVLSSRTSSATNMGERPSYNDYTNTVDMGTWCGNAVEERGDAIDTTFVFLPCVSSPQGLVISAKQKVRISYPLYIKPSVLNVTAVLNTEGVDGLKWTNDVSLLMYCSLPTNTLDETPCNMLSSPSTTGGWYAVKVCLTNMVKTRLLQLDEDFEDNKIWRLNYLSYEGWENDGWVFPKTNWGSAKNTAEDNWTFIGTPWPLDPLPFRYSEGASYQWNNYPFGYLTNYVASIFSSYNYIGYHSASTNIGHSADVYMICSSVDENIMGINIAEYPTNYDNTIFDVQGLDAAIIATNWVSVTNFPESCEADNDVLVGVVGNSENDPGFPSWCDEPLFEKATTRGFVVKDGLTVLNWDGPNGFQFR